jgi:hypothetical protein
MSQKIRAIVGAAAIALTLGAVPLAAGRDFSAGGPTGQHLKGTPARSVNRANKADGPVRVSHLGTPMQTISLQLSGFSNTSVLVRMPAAPIARSGSSVPSSMKPETAKQTLACEPVVSILTEVAKLLEPGRCVT